jgi:2-hydroxy-6-oxonona-2,4-dienedioate hydrolase
MTSMFKSQQAREVMLEWYERFATRLPGDLERRKVPTRLGETHVLVGGPADGPPLVLLHGALASSAAVLGELSPLLNRFRVYAVDVLGQSAMSADARPSVKNDEYGEWLVEVMDALGCARAHLVGISWGGFVSVRLAVVAPERIDRLVLLAPAGMVSGPFWAGLTKVGWPMMRYQRSPTPENLRRAMQHMLTTLDDEWLPYLGAALTSYTMNMQVPRLATADELKRFTAPTLVIGAELDLSFPGEQLVARARQLFSGPLETEVLMGARHSPPTTDAFRLQLSTRVSDFLVRPLQH